MNGGTAKFINLVNVEIFLILGQADPNNQIHSQRDHTGGIGYLPRDSLSRFV